MAKLETYIPVGKTSFMHDVYRFHTIQPCLYMVSLRYDIVMIPVVGFDDLCDQLIGKFLNHIATTFFP